MCIPGKRSLFSKTKNPKQTMSTTASSSTYDYVFIGGGTAGIAAAARLAQRLPNNTVAVLEAGQDLKDNPEVRVPASYVKNLGNPERDWIFMSEGQEHAGGRPVYLPRGKSLGGSSNLNFLQMNRSTKEEHDAFSKTGISGWSWNEMLPYFKESEKLTAPEDAQRRSHIKINKPFHGTSGAVDVTLPTEIATPHEYFIKAMNEIGVKTNPDPSTGDNRGVWTSGAAVDPVTHMRASADTAYLKNKDQLTNLTVILGAHVTRIVFNKTTAEGVEYSVGEESKTVSAKKEVILSAGAYQTPQLLELSGIGDPKILSKFNIPTVVDLPAVGTNLQEHIYSALTFEMKPGYTSWDVLRDEAVLAKEVEKLSTGEGGKLTTIPFAFSYLSAKQVWSDSKIKEIKTQMGSQLDAQSHVFASQMVGLQKEWIDAEVPFLEVLLVSTFMPSTTMAEPEVGKNYYSLAACLQHPLSQGSVHIKSATGTEKPSIDPQFLKHPLDMSVLVDGMEYCRKIAATKAFKEITLKEVAPTAGAPLEDYVKANFSPVFHPIGTAAMLPRNAGGVVDANLKVYGTTNLRVVDASILPLHFTAHPMATVYAIAEKAVDIIAGESKKY